MLSKNDLLLIIEAKKKTSVLVIANLSNKDTLPSLYLERLIEFSEDFNDIYQFCNSSTIPVPNQTNVYSILNNKLEQYQVKYFFHPELHQTINKKFETYFETGDKFKTLKNDYWIFTGNDDSDGWFLCTKEIASLLERLKLSNKVCTIVGKEELVKELLIVFGAFNVETKTDSTYIFTL